MQILGIAVVLFFLLVFAEEILMAIAELIPWVGLALVALFIYVIVGQAI